MNHELILSKFELQTSLLSAKNQIALSALRSDLVEKYGEDGVAKVENQVANKREEEYARHRI